MKGKKRRSGFTNNFLIDEGCAPGSTVVMMENAFVTEVAWEEIAPATIVGYRSIPVVIDNPQSSIPNGGRWKLLTDLGHA